MSLIAALVLSSFVAAPAPKDDPAKEAQAALQGEWRVTKAVKHGDDRTEGEANNTFVIKGDTLMWTEGKRVAKATLTLDPKAKPQAIDFVVTDRDQKIHLKGIYKLEKDQLTICYSFDDNPRPTEFKSEKNSGTGILILERVKK